MDKVRTRRRRGNRCREFAGLTANDDCGDRFVLEICPEYNSVLYSPSPPLPFAFLAFFPPTIVVSFCHFFAQTSSSSSSKTAAPPPVAVRIVEAREGEYGTREYTASIEVKGERAGYISACLLIRPSDNFHAACDADSQELQVIGGALFGSNGKARYPALRSDQSAVSGGFLYISTFRVAPKHRRGGSTDVGAAAIRALLSLPELGGRWAVAAYIADGAEWKSAEDRSLDDDARTAKDSRQFMRAGFKEIDWASLHSNNDYITMYMTRGVMTTPLMSHEDALAVPMIQPIPSINYKRSGKDAELFNFIMASLNNGDIKRGGGASPAALGGIDRLIREGANPTRANALHLAAANGIHELFHPLVKRGADINGRGSLGDTPLMLAAESAPGRTTLYEPNPSSVQMEMLIALGADKNLTDNRGRTALGYFYSAVRSTNDFIAALLPHEPWMKSDRVIVDMLMPASGPSDADKECEDDHVEEDDDDNDDNESRRRRLKSLLPRNMVIKSVKDAERHTKKCSDCGMLDWENGDYYVTDDVRWWDADKLCLYCAEMRFTADESDY